jgi:hypothetical protein
VIGASIDSREAGGLQFEPRCLSRQSERPRHPICIRHDGSDNPLKIYQDLADRLHNGIDDTNVLCAIDTSLVLSLRECPFVIPGSYLGSAPQFAFADLSQLLARNWQRHGWTARADRLYSLSYSMMNSENRQELGKLGVLRQWISTKIALNMIGEAKSLARLHTAIARQYFNCGGGPRFVLIGSLQLQAETFRNLGDLAEAQRLQNEAKQIVLRPEDCRGRCPGSPPSRACDYKHR